MTPAEKPIENPELELVCRVYNINSGKNKELLDRCPWLKEYADFVDYVREFHRENGYDNLENAIERAIDRCIEENLLTNFLTRHRSEVVKAMTLDYTFDRQLMLEREDARIEGHMEGLAEGEEKSRISLVCKKMKKGMSAEAIADLLEEDPADIMRICNVAERFAPDYDCDCIYEELHR